MADKKAYGGPFEKEPQGRDDRRAGGGGGGQGVRRRQRTDLHGRDLPVRALREEQGIRLLPGREPDAPGRGESPRGSRRGIPRRLLLLRDGGDLRPDDPLPDGGPHPLFGRSLRRDVPPVRAAPATVRPLLRLRRHGESGRREEKDRREDEGAVHRDADEPPDEDRRPERG